MSLAKLLLVMNRDINAVSSKTANRSNRKIHTVTSQHAIHI